VTAKRGVFRPGQEEKSFGPQPFPPGAFKTGETFVLNGRLGPSGGSVTAVNQNGTRAGAAADLKATRAPRSAYLSAVAIHISCTKRRGV
jgi:hypothetical protein